MTDEDLKLFLMENSTAIKAAARDAMIERVKENLKWQMPDDFSKILNEFIKTEIAPNVQEALMSEKGAIITAMTAACAEIGDNMAKAMVLQAAEALKGYKASDVFKSVMGVR